jgi:hypothetical protein
LAEFAAAGLFVLIKSPKSAVPFGGHNPGSAVLCSGIVVYIAQPGGQVRHPEFRLGENPTPSSESARNDK